MPDLKSILEVEERVLREIEGNLSAYASLIGWSANDQKVAYASSPITTGKILYDEFRRLGVTSVDELKRADSRFFSKVFQENIAEGERFADSLRKSGRYAFVISPGTFFMKGYTQEHYMALWERVIRKFRPNVHLNVKIGWQYSNGCSEESLIRLQLGDDGLFEGLDESPMAAKIASQRVKSAVEDVASIGADVRQLYTMYRRLELLTFTDQKTDEYALMFKHRESTDL